jgi:hypothetical protein
LDRKRTPGGLSRRRFAHYAFLTLLECNYIKRYTNGCCLNGTQQRIAATLPKHGLDFADAELVFAGPCVTFVDSRFETMEKNGLSLWACSSDGW